MNIASESCSGKQLINVILDLKSENRLYKGLNKIKDDIIQAKIHHLEEIKKEILSHEATFQANEQLISTQKVIIDDLNQQVDHLNNQLASTKSSADGKSKLMDSHKNAVQSLAYKLKEAQKYIDDQNSAIDQLRKKLSDNKIDFENIKKALKERCLERLEKANREMEEEREAMARKLRQTREFYDAEGQDYKKKIDQLQEELDLLRRADFNKPDQSTSRGRGRKRPTSTTKDPSEATSRRGKGRSTVVKKTRISRVDSSNLIDDELEFTATKKKPEPDSMFADTQTATDRSLSPIDWRRTSQQFANDSDTE